MILQLSHKSKACSFRIMAYESTVIEAFQCVVAFYEQKSPSERGKSISYILVEAYFIMYTK